MRSVVLQYWLQAYVHRQAAEAGPREDDCILLHNGDEGHCEDAFHCPHLPQLASGLMESVLAIKPAISNAHLLHAVQTSATICSCVQWQ